MFNVESDCYLDKRVLRYVTFSIPGFPAFCWAAPRLFSPIHVALGAYLPQSGCTVWRSWGDPGVAPRFSAQSMFWQLCPDEVVSIPADRTNVEREIWWRTKKEKWTWQQAEHGQVMNGAVVHGRHGNIHYTRIGGSSWTTDLFTGMPPTCRPMHSRRQFSSVP